MALTVAVVAGGRSAEADVSRSSAKEVTDALRQTFARVELLELDENLFHGLAALAPDVVFPVLHGPPGEDGTIQGFFEILGYPYVGSDVRGSAAAMDKRIAKLLFRDAGIEVLDDIYVAPSEDVEAAAARVLAALGDRVVIKPCNQGSAIGVTPLPQGGDLAAPLREAMSYGGALVEPFIHGREITVGVLDLDGEAAKSFPVTEIETSADEWYDFTNRYTPGKSRHIIPAKLEAAVTAKLQETALNGHRALGLRDLSRADFIVAGDDSIILLEINTLPGMTPTSLYPDGAAAAGITFATLVAELVESAARRQRNSGAGIRTQLD